MVLSLVPSTDIDGDRSGTNTTTPEIRTRKEMILTSNNIIYVHGLLKNVEDK